MHSLLKCSVHQIIHIDFLCHIIKFIAAARWCSGTLVCLLEFDNSAKHYTNVLFEKEDLTWNLIFKIKYLFAWKCSEHKPYELYLLCKTCMVWCYITVLLVVVTPVLPTPLRDTVENCRAVLPHMTLLHRSISSLLRKMVSNLFRW